MARFGFSRRPLFAVLAAAGASGRGGPGGRTGARLARTAPTTTPTAPPAAPTCRPTRRQSPAPPTTETTRLRRTAGARRRPSRTTTGASRTRTDAPLRRVPDPRHKGGGPHSGRVGPARAVCLPLAVRPGVRPSFGAQSSPCSVVPGGSGPAWTSRTRLGPRGRGGESGPDVDEVSALRRLRVGVTVAPRRAQGEDGEKGRRSVHGRRVSGWAGRRGQSRCAPESQTEGPNQAPQEERTPLRSPGRPGQVDGRGVRAGSRYSRCAQTRPQTRQDGRGPTSPGSGALTGSRWRSGSPVGVLRRPRGGWGRGRP